MRICMSPEFADELEKALRSGKLEYEVPVGS